MYFSQNIRLLRKAAKMTQLDLGDYLGVGHVAVSSYEKGLVTPKFEGLIKLSELFNVSLDDLVFKDLSQDPAQKAASDLDKDALLKQLMQRVALMEELIKARDPELAQKLGIE